MQEAQVRTFHPDLHRLLTENIPENCEMKELPLRRLYKKTSFSEDRSTMISESRTTRETRARNPQNVGARSDGKCTLPSSSAARAYGDTTQPARSESEATSAIGPAVGKLSPAGSEMPSL